MNSDCMVWEGLSFGRKQAEAVKAFPAVDEIDAQMRQTASAIMADPRRRDAVQRDCPQRFAEMEELLREAGTASPLDLALLPTQLQSLSDAQLEEARRAIEAELLRRRA